MNNALGSKRHTKGSEIQKESFSVSFNKIQEGYGLTYPLRIKRALRREKGKENMLAINARK